MIEKKKKKFKILKKTKKESVILQINHFKNVLALKCSEKSCF